MPELSGYAHVAITVSDLDTSLAFYEKLLGSGPVGRIELDGLDRRIFSVGNGQIFGVTAYTGGSSAAFDPTVPGLDHIGLAVTDRDGVVAWQEHATSVGIESDLQDADFGHALMIKDPDGNQIEFFAPPAQN
ncbi:VOC family protein [Frigoribacterium sp. CFBP 8751]|uniref:VOC family protein n=1 Tax=Frigoribacterium sp. CFBP 8751 TaxID=2775277 RepID=UPI0017872984|nr:VOC family protein [Frigoribacterium sp. CFBP 8751]MBD8539926.1 VOC family protein [Frigoribacterium sp. CFBP 8751]